MRKYKIYSNPQFDQVMKDQNPDSFKERTKNKNTHKVVLHISESVWKTFCIRVGKLGCSKTDLASEAIAYWCLTLARRADEEAIIEDAIWRGARWDKNKNRALTKKEKAAKTRKGFHTLYPGEPWPHTDNLSKGDVQLDFPLS
jgi:hypothetical protein